MFILFPPFSVFCVAPYAGAWIEIVDFKISIIELASLPTRERGLKSLALHPIQA